MKTYRRICHDLSATLGATVEHFRGAAADRQWCSEASSDGADASGIRETDFGEKKSNANTAGSFDSRWYHADQPLPHSCKGQKHENESLDENGSQRNAIRYGARTAPAHNLVSEIGI